MLEITVIEAILCGSIKTTCHREREREEEKKKRRKNGKNGETIQLHTKIQQEINNIIIIIGYDSNIVKCHEFIFVVLLH